MKSRHGVDTAQASPHTLSGMSFEMKPPCPRSSSCARGRGQDRASPALEPPSSLSGLL